MIGARQVAVRRPLVAAPRPRFVRVRERLARRPAIAGREQLAEALGRSPLVQLMLVTTLVAIAFLLYLAQASQLSIIQYDVQDLRVERMQLNAQNANLHARAAQLQSIQRVDAYATTQLHMAKPDLSSTIWVQPVAPRVVVPSIPDSSAAAEARSRPSAWITRFISLVRSSL